MGYLKAGGVAVVAAAGIMALGSAGALSAGGQTVRAEPAVAQPALEILSGRGSRIGASIREVDRTDVDRHQLREPGGAVVEDVRGDSPADRAGLQAGDVVVEFDGERVRGARQLSRLVQETPEGRTVGIAVLRDGQRLALEVTPESAPWLEFGGPRRIHPTLPPLELRMPDFEARIFRQPGRLGAGVQDLTPGLAEYFGAEGGVLVTSVADDSPAAAAGLRAGDVIISVNDRSTRDTRALRQRLGEVAEGGSFTIGIIRDRKPMTLTGDLPEPERRTRRRLRETI